MKNRIFTISGPSAVGKSQLIEALQKKIKIAQVRSVTTRPLRGEEDNRIHVSIEDFLYMQQNDMLIESIFYDAHAYGVPKFLVKQLLCEGHVIIDCNEAGVRQVMEAGMAPTTTIFLVANAQELYDRQMKRGAGTLESRIWRLQNSLSEIEGCNNTDVFQYVIHNGVSFDATVEKLIRIINGIPVESDYFDYGRFQSEMKAIIARIS